MATRIRKTVPKISVQIWRPLIDKLDAKIEAACLRRDAYLSKVLAVELEWLDEEVSIPNSESALAYVADRLDQLDRKLVSLALPVELTSQLNEICSRKRIVRDAFFNRVFLLLAASPSVIDILLFEPEVHEEWRREVWSEHRNEGPFFENSLYPLEPVIDPFWAIRRGIQMYVDESKLEDYREPSSSRTIQVTRDITGAPLPIKSIYTTVFDRPIGDLDLLGLSCYMPDWQVPQSDAAQRHRAKLDDLMAKLGLPS